MDRLPLINKVDSLLIQEEMQRNVSNTIRVEPTAMATKGQNFASNSTYNSNGHAKGKERPMCTHHGKLGHIVGKCYKLHRFPLGFRFKGKNSMAHQVSFSHDYYQSQVVAPSQDLNSRPANSGHAPSFTPDQYNNLLALIGFVSTSAQ